MISAALAAIIALIAVGTVIGAMLGRWSRRSTPIAATLAVGLILLAVVALDLAPDVVSDLVEAGRPWWPAALVGAAGFLAAGRLRPWGCLCEVGPSSNRPSIVVALAIGLHRAVEGSALVVAGSIPLAMVVIVHAAGEGYALGTAAGDRRHGLVWLAVACACPLVGATALTALPLPDAVHPFLTAGIAGALAQTALAAMRSARRGLRRPWTRWPGRSQRSLALRDPSHRPGALSPRSWRGRREPLTSPRSTQHRSATRRRPR